MSRCISAKYAPFRNKGGILLFASLSILEVLSTLPCTRVVSLKTGCFVPYRTLSRLHLLLMVVPPCVSIRPQGLAVFPGFIPLNSYECLHLRISHPLGLSCGLPVSTGFLSLGFDLGALPLHPVHTEGVARALTSFDVCSPCTFPRWYGWVYEGCRRIKTFSRCPRARFHNGKRKCSGERYIPALLQQPAA